MELGVALASWDEAGSSLSQVSWEGARTELGWSWKYP